MKLLINRVVKSWRSPVEFVLPDGEFKLNNAGGGRRFISHTKSPIAAEAFQAFGLSIDAPEPMFGHLVGNNYADGAFVHEHTDPAPNGFAHVRCNWMVKKPPVGGDPVIDDEVISVSEGDLWLCLASMERHATTPIFGGERLICSFGALVNLTQLNSVVLSR